MCKQKKGAQIKLRTSHRYGLSRFFFMMAACSFAGTLFAGRAANARFSPLFGSVKIKHHTAKDANKDYGNQNIFRHDLLTA